MSLDGLESVDEFYMLLWENIAETVITSIDND